MWYPSISTKSREGHSIPLCRKVGRPQIERSPPRTEGWTRSKLESRRSLSVSNRPGIVRPSRRQDDDELHACASPRAGGCPQPAGWDVNPCTAGAMPIRIRTSDKWPHRRNSLKRQRSWRMVHKPQWRVIRTEIGESGSYADRPKHC